MAHVNRRIGKSSETANVTADGTGGGVLDAFIHDYFNRSGNLYNAPGAVVSLSGLTATGGVISDYTDGGDVYRAHIFTASGSLVVSDITSDFPTTAKVLIVAGGGGGGGGPNWAGGGGAGGLLESTTFPLAQRTYPVTIGGGGGGGHANTQQGTDGGPTTFTDPGGPTTYTATGGGGGGAGNTPKSGRSGGSGGGAGENSTAGPGTQGNASPFFTGYGNDGGGSAGPNNASGGGGAGSSGVNITTKYPGTRYVVGPDTGATQPGPNVVGGSGRANTFAYGPTNPQSYAGGGGAGYFDWDGPGGPNLGSGVLNPTNSITDMNTAPGPATNSGLGGGGKGGAYYQGIPRMDRQGTPGTGGGGGGGIQTTPRTPLHPNAPQPADGGTGGSGTVIVAYQIGSVSSAKATGGAISFYNGKTIHTFTGSGTFTNTSGSPISIEYVCVAGGASGGSSDNAGGGGAGGYLTGTTTCPTSPVTVTVGAGGAFTKVLQGLNGNPGGLSGAVTVSVSGGGFGARSGVGGAGGSGGGSSYNFTPGGGPAPDSNQGNPGGAGGTAGPAYGAGGGGGAGGAGGDGSGASGGDGGVGVQLPSTFRDPKSTVGFPGSSGTYWVAGGGGGASDDVASTTGGGGGAASRAVAPYAGAGAASFNPNPGVAGESAKANSGSGGGGAGSPATYGGAGGSGLVLIAYPT